MNRSAAAGALAAVLLHGPVSAPAVNPAGKVVLDLDPDATSIRFTLGATMHTVRGTAALQSGSVRLHVDGGLSGSLVVAAAGLETGHRKRDRKMHEKVLESATYPRIVFRPQRFDGDLDLAAGGEIIVSGEMEIHGAAHSMELPVTVGVDGERVTAVASFAIPYVDWGLDDPSFFLLRVEKHVDVHVELVGTLHGAAPDAP